MGYRNQILLTVLCSIYRASSASCSNCSQFQGKNTFSGARFLFVAGLEGSAHHAIKPLLKGCLKSNVCKYSAALNAALYSGGSKAPRGPFVYGSDAQSLKRIQSSRDHLVELFYAESRKANLSNLIIMNTLGKGNMLSYPNYLGEHRTLHRPNIHQLAIMAESARVDLRILVLHRSTHATRLSTTQHRHFETEAREMAVLGDNAAALTRQLKLIDPRFFVCAESSSLGDSKLWHTKLGPGIHPYLRDGVESLAMVSSHTHSQAKQSEIVDLDAFELHFESMNAIISHSCLIRDVTVKEATSTNYPSLSASALPMEILLKDQTCMECSQFQKKNHFQGIKFVFIAGLEGSGHQVMSSVLHNSICSKKGICNCDQKLTDQLHSGKAENDPFIYGSDEQTIKDANKHSAQVISRFRILGNQRGKDGIFIINTFCPSSHTSDMSYPEKRGTDDPLEHPNLHQLANLAEEAGVDLRIVVMSRPSLDIIETIRNSRKMGEEGVELATLGDNAAVLSAQLELIDPRFFVCLNYSSIVDSSTSMHTRQVSATDRSREMNLYELYFDSMSSMIDHNCAGKFDSIDHLTADLSVK